MENHLVQQTFKFKRKKNVVKKFLQLIDIHFLPTNKLHRTFDRNTVKVSYSCTQKKR